MQAQRDTRKLVESTFVTLDGVISNPQVWGGAKYWDDEYLRVRPRHAVRRGRASAGA